MSNNDCTSLGLTPRLTAICKGEVNLPLSTINKYRTTGFAGRTRKLPALAKATGDPSPSIVILGWNFASAMLRAARAGFARCGQREINRRLAICQACPHLKDQHCGLCGCACSPKNQ